MNREAVAAIVAWTLVALLFHLAGRLDTFRRINWTCARAALWLALAGAVGFGLLALPVDPSGGVWLLGAGVLFGSMLAFMRAFDRWEPAPETED